MSDQVPAQMDVTFRRFEPADLPACAHMAAEAWPPESKVAATWQVHSGMESYIAYSLNLSNWSEVAVSAEGVIGFLFGRIDNYKGGAAPKKSVLGELPSSVKWFLTRKGKTLWHVSFAWNILLTELKLALKTPDSDASIEMFIVDSRYRGRGVGGLLLDRFLAAAKEAGSSLVTVYTDDMMSNWSYYERRGFKRVGVFYDNVTSHYSGSDAHGIIFSLDLKI